MSDCPRSTRVINYDHKYSEQKYMSLLSKVDRWQPIAGFTKHICTNNSKTRSNTLLTGNKCYALAELYEITWLPTQPNAGKST